jgi:DNA-binding GntR family transcriptional regulator
MWWRQLEIEPHSTINALESRDSIKAGSNATMPATLTEHAFHFIREKILLGDLGPPGTRVSDLEVAKMIGISRTPVREAINQLASEGLLQRRSHHGAFIRLPSNEEMEELYDLRILLESYAAERAATRLDGKFRAKFECIRDEMHQLYKEMLAEGQNSFNRQLSLRWFIADSAFHITVLAASQNRKILKIASDSRMMTQVLGQRWVHHTVRGMTRIYNDHVRLIEAILEGQVRRARQMMTDHISKSKAEHIKFNAEYEANKLDAAKQMNEDWYRSIRQLLYHIECERIPKFVNDSQDITVLFSGLELYKHFW